MTTLSATEEALLQQAFGGGHDVRRAVVKLIAEALASIESNLALGGTLSVAGALSAAAAFAAAGGVNLAGASGTPASAAAAGTAGDVKWDSSYVYVCVATNTWLRAAIATW